MKKILTNLLLIGALFFVFPFMVKAEVFNDGDMTYSIEKVGEPCDLVQYAWIQGMDSNGNYIYSNTDMNVFYKVSVKNNECSTMSIQESLDFINNDYAYEYFSLDEEKFTFNKTVINYYTDMAFMKTKDTEETFDPNKEYFIPTIDGNGFQSGFITKKEDVQTYYEIMYFKFPEKATKVDGIEYYIHDDETGGLKLVLDSEFKEEDMLKYRVLTTQEESESSTKFLELDSNIFSSIFDKNYYHDLIYNEENGTINIIVMNKENNKFYIYDKSGNLVKELGIYDGISIFSDSLIAAYLNDGFIIFNKEFNKIFESTSIQPAQLFKYEDYVYYTFGFDENGNMLFYNINEYKLLTEDNQIYNSNDLIISFSGLKDKIKSIKVNDIELAKENYELTDNITNITLKKSYLDTLKKGDYNLVVEYTDGVTLKSKFIIEKEVVNESNQPTSNGEEVPQTFDGVSSSILTSILSLLLIFGSVIYLKKQKNERA